MEILAENRLYYAIFWQKSPYIKGSIRSCLIYGKIRWWTNKKTPEKTQKNRPQ
uniref:Uncharacterized protein n=1 Tax=Siphoviridae sp. ctiJm4 TaxID=2827916 RepID=A0A8S5T1V1_9CAUD|nr:MAG TPA: hypothetical protein [Siphoviridae sp. ctiJm4]